VAARRIVSQDLEQRRYDPNPPQFRVGSDDEGVLIYSNEVIQAPTAYDLVGRPLQLEYTTRLDCPGSNGDPLFRDAFVWKLAANLALPLSRDKDKADWAERNYQVMIVAAKATAANEEQKDNDTGDAPWITAR